MKFFLYFVGTTTLLILTNTTPVSAQTENSSDLAIRRRLMTPHNSPELERREAEVMAEFPNVEAFADSFVRRWQETTDLKQLQAEFLSTAEAGKVDFDFRGMYRCELPDGITLDPEDKRRLSIAYLNFAALEAEVRLLSDQEDEENGPIELQRQFVTLEQRWGALFEDPPVSEPKRFVDEVCRFTDEVAETCRPFLTRAHFHSNGYRDRLEAHRKQDASDAVSDRDVPFDFPAGPRNQPRFYVHRGVFLISIEKENGAYRVVDLDVIQ